MPIREHPTPGTIITCDFDSGFKEPEMVKRRPVVVVSPKIGLRPKLCTVVPISTQEPQHKMAYHYEIDINPSLPPPWDKGPNWVKGDMIMSVGFHRLDLIRLGKDKNGKRFYRFDTVSNVQMREIRKCMLCSLGMTQLTKHIP